MFRSVLASLGYISLESSVYKYEPSGKLENIVQAGGDIVYSPCLGRKREIETHRSKSIVDGLEWPAKVQDKVG